MEGKPQRRTHSEELIDPHNTSESEQEQLYQPAIKKLKCEKVSAEEEEHSEQRDEEGLLLVSAMSSSKDDVQVLDAAEDATNLEDDENKADSKSSAIVSPTPRPLMETDITPSLNFSENFPDSSNFSQIRPDMYRHAGDYRMSVHQSNTGNGADSISNDTNTQDITAEGDAEPKPSLLGSPPSDAQEGSKKIPSLLNIDVFPPSHYFSQLRSPMFYHPGDYRIPMQMAPPQSNPVDQEIKTQEDSSQGDGSLLETSSDVQEGSKKIPSLLNMDVYPVPSGFRQQWPAYYQPAFSSSGMYMSSYRNNTWRGGRTDTIKSDIKTEDISTVKAEDTAASMSTEAETQITTPITSEVDHSIFKSELKTQDPIK